jgi:hypothetical protein
MANMAVALDMAAQKLGQLADMTELADQQLHWNGQAHRTQQEHEQAEPIVLRTDRRFIWEGCCRGDYDRTVADADSPMTQSESHRIKTAASGTPQG